MNIFQEAKSVLDKDGKVNALGPFGKSKLSGREISTYFRRNKVKDAKIRKAVEVALDLGGAYDIASREIKKFYGDKILKSKEVQNALMYANEEVVLSVKEDLQEVALDQNMLQRQFPNVWATKDSKLYRVLFSLISFHGYNDNVKAYKKNPKAFIDSLRNIAKNPGKHKELGPNFKQYVEKPKKGQAFAEAVSPAQQAAIAISKKEKGEKPKNEDAEAKAKLALKHAQEKEKLAQKHSREKEAMSESNMMDVDKAPKNKWKALGFSQHPHKGFEGERMPKGMRDYRKKALTPTQLMKKKMNVMDSYRAMWEEGEKYAPIEENMERSIMKKMRRGKVAKGMPR